MRNIEEEIKREITDSPWLDEKTRAAAQEKIDAMTNFVGYPDWYDEPGKVDEYYREVSHHLSISRQGHFQKINNSIILIIENF